MLNLLRFKILHINIDSLAFCNLRLYKPRQCFYFLSLSVVSTLALAASFHFSLIYSLIKYYFSFSYASLAEIPLICQVIPTTTKKYCSRNILGIYLEIVINYEGTDNSTAYNNHRKRLLY